MARDLTTAEEVRRTIERVRDVREKVWKIHTTNPLHVVEVGRTPDRYGFRLTVHQEGDDLSPPGVVASVVLSHAGYVALRDSLFDLDIQPREDDEGEEE